MGFPAAGFEGLFRNSLDDVAAMLKRYHANHFMIVNLSERGYNRTMFGPHRVLDAPFPDHYSPPLELLFRIVYEMHAFLTEDARNVAIVHCLAGRGRTGTVIASYLYFLALFDTPADALDFFALRRSQKLQGVTKPSQRRYVRYFAGVLATGRCPERRRVRLARVVFNGIPTFQNKSEAHAGCRPVVNVYSTHTYPPTLLFSSLWWTQTHVPAYVTSDELAVFDMDGIELQSDFLIRAFHLPPRAKIVEDEAIEMFRVSLHTAFIESTCQLLKRTELEGAHTHHEGRFPDDFAVQLVFDLASCRPLGPPAHGARSVALNLPLQAAGHWKQLREAHLALKAMKSVRAMAVPLAGSWREGYTMPAKPDDLARPETGPGPVAAGASLYVPTETERVMTNGERVLEYSNVRAAHPEHTAHRPSMLRYGLESSAGELSPFAVLLTSPTVHRFGDMHAFVAGQILARELECASAADGTADVAGAVAPAPVGTMAGAAVAAATGSTMPAAAAASGAASGAQGTAIHVVAPVDTAAAAAATTTPPGGGQDVDGSVIDSDGSPARTLPDHVHRPSVDSMGRDTRTLSSARKSRQDVRLSTAIELPDSADDGNNPLRRRRSVRWSRIVGSFSVNPTSQNEEVE